jgi:hypothetical protein
MEPPKPSAPRKAPELTTIEAVFAAWGGNAVWSDDVTEVALWNIEDKAFTNFYEVRRYGDTYYFRTIPRLTRRIIARGKPLPDSPLQFTETEEQYREWLKYGRVERPADREPQQRPTFSPPPAAEPVNRSIKPSTPSLQSPELKPSLPPPVDAPTPETKGPARK